MSMSVIVPSEVTPTYTNVPANTEAEYNAATTYAKGNTVQIASLNRVYESQVDTNLGNYPPDNPLKWLDLGATEQYKMLDEFVNTQTSMATQLHVKVQVDKINHLLLLGVVGTAMALKLWDTTATSTTSVVIGTGSKSFVTQAGKPIVAGDPITITDQAITGNSMTGTIASYNAVTGDLAVTVTSITGSGTISAWNIASLLWYEDIDLTYTDPRLTAIEDWQQYFFGMDARLYNDIFRAVSVLAFTPTLEITINYAGGTAKLAKVVAGQAVYVGKTQFGAAIGIMSFSKKTTDEWGRTSLKKGASAKTNSLSVWIESARVDVVNQWLTELDGIPCAWIGDGNGGTMALMGYGFYRDFGIVLEQHNQTLCRIEWEGLI